ncbi:MAG: hypothetical protein ACM3N4_11960 [Nitrososphaerota archaeon]
MRPSVQLAQLALLAVSLLAGLAGCGVSQQIHIDWINFIRFQGIEYLANSQMGREMQPADLGAQFATVRANVSTSSCQAQDGCASYSEPGTPVYRVAGYASTFRLAVYQGDRIVLFEADTNPHAKTGADLLDIGGKVQSITITGDSGTATPRWRRLLMRGRSRRWWRSCWRLRLTRRACPPTMGRATSSPSTWPTAQRLLACMCPMITRWRVASSCQTRLSPW